MEIYSLADIKKGLPSLVEFDEVNTLVTKTVLNSEYAEFIKAFFHYGSFSWKTHNIFSDLDYYVLWNEGNRDMFDSFLESMSKIPMNSSLKVMFRLKDTTDFLEDDELFRMFCIKELLKKDNFFFSGTGPQSVFLESIPTIDFQLIHSRLINDINEYIDYIENINIENINEGQLRTICKFPLKVVRDYLIYMTHDRSFKYPADTHDRLIDVYSKIAPNSAMHPLGVIFQIKEEYKTRILSCKNKECTDEKYREIFHGLTKIIEPLDTFLKENLIMLKASLPVDQGPL